MAEGAAADKAYEAALREIERVREAARTDLRMSGEVFADLETVPPEVATIVGLRTLDLSRTKVSDLEPLKGMTTLESLQLSQTAVSDISPLQRMTALRRLSLYNTNVTDLAPLSELTAMQYLTLVRTGVSDLSPLQDMIALESLRIDATAVSDLSPVRKMSFLERFSLDGTSVSDLSPLRKIRALRELWLSQTAVSDLSPLIEITAIQGLRLSRTAVSDLSPLREMTAMRTLSISYTEVSDLRPIAALPFYTSGEPLYSLSFRGTPATKHDPEMQRLSIIVDGKQRTRETLAYLKTLPPWPEPYRPATRGGAPALGQIRPSENQTSSKIAREEPPMSRGALKAKTSAAHIRFLQREPELTRLTAQSVATQIRDAMLEMRRRSNDIPDALLKIESLADALDGIGNAPLAQKGEKRIEDLQLRIAQLEAVIEKLTADLTVSKAATTNPNGFAATLSKEAAREIATSLGFLTRLGAIAGLVYFIGPTNPVATGLIGAWAAITKLVK